LISAVCVTLNLKLKADNTHPLEGFVIDGPYRLLLH